MSFKRQTSTIAIGLAILAAAIAMAAQSRETKKYVEFTGVNLSGGEFGADKLPGRFGTNYIYPTRATIDYFAAKGMNVVRVSVLWERLQHRLGSGLYEVEMRRIDSVIDYAQSKGLKVVLNVHNYAAYRGAIMGSEHVPVTAFAEFWRQLAARYRGKDSVIFGLMHAPAKLATETWLHAANLAIAEIRNAQAQNLILVSGNGWSSARDWMNSHYGTPNGQVMLKVADPRNNYMYEVHQFFDESYAGAQSECRNVKETADALKPFTDWLRQHRKRGFLGQFGAGDSRNCLEVLNQALAYMAQNNDVWHGWTYWAAGEWWANDFFANLQPVDGKDRPQMAVLAPFMKPVRPRLDGKE